MMRLPVLVLAFILTFVIVSEIIASLEVGCSARASAIVRGAGKSDAPGALLVGWLVNSVCARSSAVATAT